MGVRKHFLRQKYLVIGQPLTFACAAAVRSGACFWFQHILEMVISVYSLPLSVLLP